MQHNPASCFVPFSTAWLERNLKHFFDHLHAGETRRSILEVLRQGGVTKQEAKQGDPGTLETSLGLRDDLMLEVATGTTGQLRFCVVLKNFG